MNIKPQIILHCSIIAMYVWFCSFAQFWGDFFVGIIWKSIFSMPFQQMEPMDSFLTKHEHVDQNWSFFGIPNSEDKNVNKTERRVQLILLKN